MKVHSIVQVVTSDRSIMEKWLVHSGASLFFYSVWAISTALAARTIDSSSFQLIQLPIRIAITVSTALSRRRPGSPDLSFQQIPAFIGDLNFHGFIFTIISCVSTVIAGFRQTDALNSGGSGSAVTAITGCYPALSYLFSLLLGLESINRMKLLGVTLAVGSCTCFALAK